jgi:hypothetical protein
MERVDGKVRNARGMGVLRLIRGFRATHDVWSFFKPIQHYLTADADELGLGLPGPILRKDSFKKETSQNCLERSGAVANIINASS